MVRYRFKDDFAHAIDKLTAAHKGECDHPDSRIYATDVLIGIAARVFNARLGQSSMVESTDKLAQWAVEDAIEFVNALVQERNA